MTLQADILHGVAPPEVMPCAGGKWLSLAIETPALGAAFSTIIDAAADVNRTYTLYLQWYRYPGAALFYPAMRLMGFQLTPANDRM